MYHERVGTKDREARRARVSYLGALAQLARVMAEFERVGVPLEPEPDGRIPPWSAEHKAIMTACAGAWDAVVRLRRVYEVALREAGSPETWPHG